ncbi:MAG TPA: M20/M25/M40 family metallo-hydrolase [Bacteroidia bacterium]|nr:M20/M25/M40 family metallo-hydrolase [Bacteroidia bacterium]
MKKSYFLFIFLAAAVVAVSSFRGQSDQVIVKPSDPDSVVFRKIFNEALTNGKAYENLNTLCTTAPKRLSGSKGAGDAVTCMFKIMQGMGLDSVWLQECTVPHWERGAPEQGEMVVGTRSIEMNICALGGSVGTGGNGITADVIEVNDFEELNKLGKKKIEGRIVFFNHPFDETKVSTFDAYGEAVGYRWAGPHLAETYGAVGVLVRSMTNSLDTFPHTGVMRMDSLKATIPSAAISTVDAEILSKQIKAGGKTSFHMKMNCQWFADAKSHNVIGEIRGTEHPEKVICFGGHLDAWDLGDGAHDDGAGCVQGIEVLRLFKALNMKPKNTIRCVLWMNEENGGGGADAYFEYAKEKKVTHVAAIESDAGGFSPRGFSLDMPEEQKTKVRTWSPLFFPYGVYDFTESGGGADIGPLKELGTPLFGLSPDSQRYFDYHHTEIDVFTAVNRRELHLGAGAMAGLVFLIDKYGL